MSEHVSCAAENTLTYMLKCATTTEKKKQILGPGYILQFQLQIFFFFLPFLSFPSLDFDTSILPICKDSLGWMFNKLDMNFDLLLDQSELSAIYLDKYELCMKPLFNSCDSFKDGKLSNNEWCYCFQKPDGEGGGGDTGLKEGLRIKMGQGMERGKKC